MDTQALTKEEFQALSKLAGFSKKYELAKILGISYNAVNSWGNTKPYPKYVKPFLDMAIKARAYDEACAQGLVNHPHLKK